MIKEIKKNWITVQAYGKEPGVYCANELSDEDLLVERGILTSCLYTGAYNAKRHEEIYNLIQGINQILDERCNET